MRRKAIPYPSRGLLVRSFVELPGLLAAAKETARQGRPVLVDAHRGATDFRKGIVGGSLHVITDS